MIGINAILLSPYSGGISTYISNLISQLEKIDSTKEKISIFLSKDQYQRYRNSFNFKLIQTPFSSKNPFQRVIWENICWNKIFKKNTIKLFHSPISYLPHNISIDSIVTIHDLRVFKYPETYYYPRGLFLKKAIKHTIFQSAKIIAVSNFTKDEILNRFKIPEEKIAVIYEGIDRERFSLPPKPEDIETIRKYGIQNNYIFTVGHLEPRKNFIRLIQAFEKLIQSYKEPLQLVIGGKENYHYSQIYQYVKEKNLQNKVILAGFIDPLDLPILYGNAIVFVLPSIYEGFGFPPLESIAAGGPVTVSRTCSLPEILDKSATYFDPFAVDDIAEKLRELLVNPVLRSDLLKEGDKILNKFSWIKCAQKTYQLYCNVLNN